LFVVSLILWWHSLVATLALAVRNDAYTHIALILPISVALICLEWTSQRARPEPNFRAGLALLVAAVLIGFVASDRGNAGSLSTDIQLSLGMLDLVAWWIGSFVCCFGTGIARRLIFPLCFLLWLVPIPGFALNRIVSFLQQGSASVAHLFLAGAGIPVTQDGVLLSIPGLTIEVAQECSSIRSSLMLLVAGMVLAQLLLHSTWGKAIVMLALIPLSLAKNGLRIFTLSMLGVYVDPSYLHGRLHHDGGIIFFLVALAALFGLLWIVRQAERNAMARHVTATALPAIPH
jgi:exosortase